MHDYKTVATVIRMFQVKAGEGKED